MSRSLSAAHLDEATLLRLVAADLDATERAAAELHLGRCAACRRERSRTEMLDATMRELAANAAKPAVPIAVVPSDDPFFRRPEPSRRLAKDAGLDGGALVAAAIDASEAAKEKKDALLAAAKKEPATLDAALTELRFDRLADRLTFGYALGEAFDCVEDDPHAWLRFGEAALERISKEPAVEGLNEMRPKPQEYAAPLAGLSAAAQLLVAAGDLLHAEFDRARVRLEAAWRSLEAGRDALPLVSRMETVASILRTIAGRPAEGLALAERAAETFAVTGHAIDVARAEFAKGLAELGAGNTREGKAALRRARGTFARAGAWRAFAISVTALAVAETGPGVGPELKGLFRASLRRLRRATALDAFQYLRASHRVLLLTRREQVCKRGGKRTKRTVEAPFFAPALVYLMRGGELLADGIVSAARESGETLRSDLRSLDAHPAGSFGLLFACQKGSVLVVVDPHHALSLARLVFDEAETLMDANLEIKAATPALRQTVQAEAKLLESQAQVQLGYAEDSWAAAIAAGELFESARDSGFGRALADYYEGQAAGFARDYTGAERLLKSALKVFAEFGQNHLMGRAEAALGTLFGQKGDAVLSLQYLDHAVQILDPETDARPLTMVLNNRAQTLARLGRFDEARAGYARALTAARTLDSKAHLFTIKTGLADLDFRRARFDRALATFDELSREATERGYENEFVITRLYVAECFGRLELDRKMADAIVALREARKASPFAPSPAIADLFDCLDQGALDADLVRNVREHLEREQCGDRVSGSLMRFVS